MLVLPLIPVIPLRGVAARIWARVLPEVQRERVIGGLGRGHGGHEGGGRRRVEFQLLRRRRVRDDADAEDAKNAARLRSVLAKDAEKEPVPEGVYAGREMSITLCRSLGGGFVYPNPKPGPDANPRVDAEVDLGARKPNVGQRMPARAAAAQNANAKETSAVMGAAQRVESSAVTRSLSERQMNAKICSTQEKNEVRVGPGAPGADGGDGRVEDNGEDPEGRGGDDRGRGERHEAEVAGGGGAGYREAPLSNELVCYLESGYPTWSWYYDETGNAVVEGSRGNQDSVQKSWTSSPVDVAVIVGHRWPDAKASVVQTFNLRSSSSCPKPGFRFSLPVIYTLP
ncbi:hypothetical protein B0H11DRAFT_1936082 [Mycena galericulata]|nr:hypothetical protein B0H11DRAFT_1936082 [Mycena galericulata]